MSGALKIGFLGAGKMATALAKGWVKAELLQAADLIASDIYEPARDAFSKELKCTATLSNPEILSFAEVIVLAVKPDQVNELLSEVKKQFTPNHLLISIAAGVPLARLETALGAGARVVRVMPNTPALVGASATGFALGKGARPEDGELTKKLFSSVGVAFQLKESLLDAVTGLSGSGPAYVFM
ncbi:MAG TPA: NAD(P)-binding domain-containing protein, partial [Verrucomicrobiae bacterium]